MKFADKQFSVLAGLAGLFLVGLLIGFRGLAWLALIALIAIAGFKFAQNWTSKYNVTKPEEPEATNIANPGTSLPGGRDTWLRGVSNYQRELKRVGKGSNVFVFVAEPENQFDNLAVKVCVQSGGQLIRIGYLPAGTDTTISIHDLARHLEKEGKFITGSGEIEDGEVGLVARVQTPDWHGLKKELLKIERDGLIKAGAFRSVATSAPSADFPKEFFRPMDIINQQEFSDNIVAFKTETGNHIVWFLLIPKTEDEIDVHLSFPGTSPGPQVGRIGKRHLQYARAYTQSGPVFGRGYLRVQVDGSVTPVLGDPDWR